MKKLPVEKLKVERRTCHITREPGSDRLWYCDNCKSYHDHQSDYAWEYCPRCGAKRVRETSDRDTTCVPDDYTAKLMAEVERLQGENAKLLKDLEAEHALAETLGHFHEAYQVENEKLRLLVRGLDYCSDELNSAECDKCPLYDPADPVLEPKCVRMMREMGIEPREMEIDKEEI